MSKIRTLFIEHPRLVEADFADRFAKLYELGFDHELANPKSVFSRQAGEPIEERLVISNIHVARNGNVAKDDYIQDLKVLAAQSVDGEIDEDLKARLEAREPKYPDVSAILTVAQASTLGFWNGD